MYVRVYVNTSEKSLNVASLISGILFYSLVA